MLGSEEEHFRENDKQKYILSNNKEILDFIEQKQKEGINFNLNINHLQTLIDEIALFFEFKYPDSLLIDILYGRNKGTEEVRNQCVEISKSLDIEQLKYRLHHDYNLFLDCPYWHNVEIKKEKEYQWDLRAIVIKMDSKGILNQHDLEELKENKYLSEIDNIETASDLLGKFIESPIEVDYSELERMFKHRKANLQLRNMILELIPLKLLYSSLPQYGYPRAKSFIRMFNQEYGLDMESKDIEEIIKDYSSIKSEIQKVKGHHK